MKTFAFPFGILLKLKMSTPLYLMFVSTCYAKYVLCFSILIVLEKWKFISLGVRQGAKYLISSKVLSDRQEIYNQPN